MDHEAAVSADAVINRLAQRVAAMVVEDTAKAVHIEVLMARIAELESGPHANHDCVLMNCKREAQE